MLERPSAGIPGDLDVALRLDLRQLRRALGPSVDRALELRMIDAEADPPAGRLLSDALQRADAVWFAFRPGLPPELTDNVILLRGAFGDLDPRSYAGGSPWDPPADLGADWRRFERARPERRSAPARLYAHSDGLLALVSYAEIDSAERSIEQRAGDPHVDPPDRGGASIAVRAAPVIAALRDRFPKVAEVLADARSLTGYADLTSTGLRAEVEVQFTDAAGARRAREGATWLLERLRLGRGWLSMVARSAKASTVGPALLIAVEASGEALGGIVLCVEDAEHCE